MSIRDANGTITEVEEGYELKDGETLVEKEEVKEEVAKEEVKEEDEKAIKDDLKSYIKAETVEALEKEFR